ncbi:hypothetical protein LCGC14_3167600, partial [marine sediment metagenome]
LLLTVALLLFSVGAVAQERIQFTGATYDGEIAITTGIGIPIGGNVWNLNWATASLDGEQSVGVEVAYILDYNDGGFYYGVLGGGSSEWADKEAGNINYITENAGLIGGYKDLYAWGKYRLQLEKGTGFENEFSFGFGYKRGL